MNSIVGISLLAAGVLALPSEGETKFFLKVVDAQIEFETDAAGTVTGLVLVQNGLRQRAPRKPVPAPPPASFPTLRMPGIR